MLICSEKKSHRYGERMYVNLILYSENKDGSFSNVCPALGYKNKDANNLDFHTIFNDNLIF